MSSQQELIDAINTISEDKNKAFDTPATVLRVEGDTVWVHIDGGIDETPVQKTIDCDEGETVQVRISNGSAFLVGNASAPPTDDTTANEARFVAEEADEKATEAVESVNAISQTVRGKVSSGNSNIAVLSSTMYQNENGVNIFNDELAAGDSYAHIDGDEFCIREVTSAGVIDDTNDPALASFGANEIKIGYIDDDESGFLLDLSPEGMELVRETPAPRYTRKGWSIDYDTIRYSAVGSYSHPSAELSSTKLQFIDAGTGQNHEITNIGQGSAEFIGVSSGSGSEVVTKTNIEGGKISSVQSNPITILQKKTVIEPGIIKVSGNIQDMNGNNKTPTILVSETISASDTSYTFTDDAITADSAIDVYDTIFGFAPTNVNAVAGSCTVTFPAQSSTHQIKLFVY